MPPDPRRHKFVVPDRIKLMTMRLVLAALHLVALGIGLGAVWARSRALRHTLDTAGLLRVFTADAWWGISAILWLTTGLARLFMSMEKSTSYYLGNHYFLLKMVLFLVILALEIAPMMTFMRWRAAVRRSERPDTTKAQVFARTSVMQAVLVVAMVFAATAMARGLDAP